MLMGFVYLTQKDFCKMSRGLNPQVSWHPEPESTHINNHPTEPLHLLLLRESTGPARGGFSGNSSAAFFPGAQPQALLVPPRSTSQSIRSSEVAYTGVPSRMCFLFAFLLS